MKYSSHYFFQRASPADPIAAQVAVEFGTVRIASYIEAHFGSFIAIAGFGPCVILQVITRGLDSLVRLTVGQRIDILEIRFELYVMIVFVITRHFVKKIARLSNIRFFDRPRIVSGFVIYDVNAYGVITVGVLDSLVRSCRPSSYSVVQIL